MRFTRRLPLAFSLLPLLCLLAGCPSMTKVADRINHDIHSETAKIKDAAQSAQANVAAADENVQAAATQPSNPPTTVVLLNQAHSHLTGAKKDLAVIAPSTAIIEKKSTQAAAVTATVQKKLDDEQD